jgi:protein-S-isoprenylcysteine O-methyltransferase Ste14
MQTLLPGLAVLFWGFLHSLLATIKAKEIALRWFGPLSGRFYRLAYNLFAGLSFLPVLALYAVLPDRLLYAIPFPWVGLAILGEILALLALLVGFRQTGPWEFLGLRQLTKKVEQPNELVTGGLYRYVRHPLYTAGLLFIWFSPLMTVNQLALNIGMTVYIIVGAYFEERKLSHEFGAQYAAYQAITPMLIPRLRLKRNKK